MLSTTILRKRNRCACVLLFFGKKRHFFYYNKMEPLNEPMNTIEPTFQSKEFVRFMGKRKLTTNSITGVFKPGMNYNFPFPKTFAQEVVLPESIVLRFKFKSANNKSWFKNNLARLLLGDLEVKIGDVVVYKLADTSNVGIYQDLWLSEEEREDMVEKGLGSEDFRKLCSGFEPAPSDATAVRLFNTTPYLCAKLDRVFEGNGSLYPSGLENILNVIRFPDASKIMVAASGSKVQGYSIEDVRLEFESVLSEGTRKEDMGKGSRNLAIEASNEYSGGKQMFFDAPFFVREEDYPKGASSSHNISINPSLSMINTVLILFKDPRSTDSERFENADIESVNISGTKCYLFQRLARKPTLLGGKTRVW